MRCYPQVMGYFIYYAAVIGGGIWLEAWSSTLGLIVWIFLLVLPILIRSEIGGEVGEGLMDFDWGGGGDGGGCDGGGDGGCD